jgi:hypothetical protein
MSALRRFESPSDREVRHALTHAATKSSSHHGSQFAATFPPFVAVAQAARFPARDRAANPCEARR